MFLDWFFIGGSLIAIAVVVIVLVLVLSKEGGMGDVLFFYDRIIPVETTGILSRLEEKLRRAAVPAVVLNDKLIVQDFVYWEISEVESKGKAYLSVKAGVRTWYFVLTVVFLALFLVIGVLLAALAYWKFITVRDKIKAILVEEAGDPSIINLL